jgi:hypothetical protein
MEATVLTVFDSPYRIAAKRKPLKRFDIFAARHCHRVKTAV